MTLGLMGRKRGMMRVFSPDGQATVVTVVECMPNRVVQVKTAAHDGYDALQVTVGARRSKRVTRAMRGHFAKAGVEAGRKVWEIRSRKGDVPQLEPGGELVVNQFSEGSFVDVTGASIGKGFAGVIKRHNFKTQDATHGNSLSHRAPGSIGQNQTPGRVFKGKKMCGHMGNERVTIHNLKIIKIDDVRQFMMVKGAVPGPKDGDLLIRPATKK